MPLNVVEMFLWIWKQSPHDEHYLHSSENKACTGFEPMTSESMTVNIWKSYMWIADEEMNMKAIFTVAIWPKIFLHQALMKKKTNSIFIHKTTRLYFKCQNPFTMESLILYFLYVDNNKILHMNTLLICLPKENKTVDFDWNR